MSVTKNKSTRYHETAQDVNFKLDALVIDHITDLTKLSIRGSLLGRVGSTDGVVERKNSSISLADIQANCTATEKSKLKGAIAIFERELARAEAELADEAHDNTDVFNL